jgi:phosphatidylethanolamine/phosphatidyl-N-methylethanolamine N-methyltransferase
VEVRTADATGFPARSVFRCALDRCVAVVYGHLHDLIVERFTPYRILENEVLRLVEAAAPAGVPRAALRVLDIGCGPGTFSVPLAAAGFSVMGIDRYAPLLDVARERRLARRLTNLEFCRLSTETFAGGSFDQIVSVHGLYVHPAPARVVAEAARLLKPGGHAVFVNHAGRFAPWKTFRDAVRTAGLLAALRTLLWLVPNACFEAARRPVGPHYWDERRFERELTASGFTVLELRRTFLARGSLLAWARKS